MGRHAELCDLDAAIGAHRLVTLLGVGGIGKTRLALQAAVRWARRHATEVVFVDLASLEHPGLAEAAMCEAAGVGASASASPLHAFLQRLADRHALVLLDNCEHLVDEVARLTTRLLAANTKVRVLATSREPLGVAGESLWDVPPLSTTPREGDVVSDAARLFAARSAGHALAADVAADAPWRRDVERLVGQLEGIPLAIELAASRPVPEDQDAGGQEAPRRAAEDRQRTMRRSLDWSLGLLQDDEALLFRRLSVFVNGWTLTAAEHICADDRLAPARVLEVLAALSDKSLVEKGDTADEPRFRMLMPVRQYAAELLTADPDHAATTARHRAYFTALAERAEREIWALDRGARRRLDRDSPNLRAALDNACRHGHEDALRIAASLGLYWKVRGRATEGAEALERALAASPPEPTPARARAVAMYGWLIFWLGRVPEAVAAAETALETAVRIGDLHSEAKALTTLSTARMIMDPRGAQPRIEQAADVARRAGDRVVLSEALSSLATSFHWQDDYDAFEKHARSGDEVASEIGYDSVLFWNLWGRAHRARLSGDLAGARRLADEFAALTINEDALLRNAAAEVVALVEAMTGETERAERTTRAQVAQFEEGEERWGIGAVHLALAFTELVTGHTRSASSRAARVYTEEQEGAGYLAWHAQEIGILAALALGDPAKARAHAAMTLEVADRLGNERAKVVAALGHAAAAVLDRDPHTAEVVAHPALTVCVAHGWRTDALTALEVLACAAALRGQNQRAVRLFSGMRAICRTMGFLRHPQLGGACEDLRGDAFEALGPRARELAVGTGERMDLRQLSEFASRGRGPRGRTPGSRDLTPMQARVAELAAQGRSNKEIGEVLFIAPGTVKNHLSQAFEKLGVHNRTALVGLFSDQDPEATPPGHIQS